MKAGRGAGSTVGKCREGGRVCQGGREVLGLGLVMGVWNDPMTPGVRGGGERQAG